MANNFSLVKKYFNVSMEKSASSCNSLFQFHKLNEVKRGYFCSCYHRRLLKQGWWMAILRNARNIRIVRKHIVEIGWIYQFQKKKTAIVMVISCDNCEQYCWRFLWNIMQFWFAQSYDLWIELRKYKNQKTIDFLF